MKTRCNSLYIPKLLPILIWGGLPPLLLEDRGLKRQSRQPRRKLTQSGNLVRCMWGLQYYYVNRCIILIVSRLKARRKVDPTPVSLHLLFTALN